MLLGGRPDGEQIYVILDNLPAHKRLDIRAWAEKSNVEMCFTPTTSCRPGVSAPISAGETRTPVRLNSSTLNAVNEHEFEPRKATAGADHTNKQPDRQQRKRVVRALAGSRCRAQPQSSSNETMARSAIDGLKRSRTNASCSALVKYAFNVSKSWNSVENAWVKRSSRSLRFWPIANRIMAGNRWGSSASSPSS